MGSGSCSASNLLCDFEPLASLFWSCFPTSEIRTCTRQLLWADQLRYSHSAISTERQLRFGRNHRCSCDVSQQSKMGPVCPSKVRVVGGFDLGIRLRMLSPPPSGSRRARLLGSQCCHSEAEWNSRQNADRGA